MNVDANEFAGAVGRCSGMRRIASLAFVIGCTPARAPVAPAVGDHVAPVAPDAAPLDAPAAVSVAPDAAALDAPAAVSIAADASVAACVYDKPDASVVLPPRFASPDRKVCDLADRVITVEGKLVTVFARPKMTRTRAKVARTEHLGDRCGDGPGGGHAGCSITYDRYWSSVLGTAHLEFGNNAGNVLEDDSDPNKFGDCRDTGFNTIASCSTAQHLVVVRYEEDPNRACWNVRASIWENAAQPRQLDGDVDRTASVGGHWVYRFGSLVLDVDGAKRTATANIDGVREDCVVFQLAR